ncbi:MAG: hypothetical protein HY904_12200 [Deltaproteobacteria bacterium]|nr:hypothetical protein [Deltaproteobacteria bacterium]
MSASGAGSSGTVLNVTVAVEPATAALNPDQQQAFLAVVTGTGDAAVDWSVVETGGGTVDAAGLYTAPSTTGTYHVRATSRVAPTASGEATITVTSTPQVSVTVNPRQVELRRGENQTFMATVTNASNTAVTWSVVEPDGGTITALGAYTAPYLGGSFHVRATSEQDPSKSDVATIQVVLPSVSGTVQFTGSDTGRVFVVVFDNDRRRPMGGTALDAPGAFTIRGVERGGFMRVAAWMDVQDTGAFNEAVDPMGEVQFDLQGNDVNGLVVQMNAPPSVAPGAAGLEMVIPAEGCIIAGWTVARDNNGRMLADEVLVEASTSSSFGTIAASRRLPTTAPFAVLELADGSYYVRVRAYNHGTEGAPSAASPPVTTGPRTGGHRVQGVVDLTGITATGPLYVVMFMEAAGAFVQRVVQPAGAQAFSITGAFDGNWYVFAFVDQDQDGTMGPGDPTTVPSRPVVTVSGADATVPTLRLPAGDALPLAQTYHWADDGTEGYFVHLGAASNLQRVVAAVLTGGPQAAPPRDLGVADAEFGALSVVTDLYAGLRRPVVGDVYDVDATLADNTVVTLHPRVSGVLELPTLTSPQGTVAAPVQFAWAPAAGAPGALHYAMSVSRDGGNGDLWRVDSLDPSMTTFTYDFDGRAMEPLVAGGRYRWRLEASDQDGNYAAVGAAFSLPVQVTVEPATATVNRLGQQVFLATVTGGGGVDWSVEETGGGTVTPEGLYTAPNVTGTFHVVAAARVDANQVARATVTVTDAPQVQVVLAPLNVVLGGGQLQKFAATVTGSGNTAVTWSVVESSGGVVALDGTYTAPPTPGTYHVRAVSSADTNKSAVATVRVLLQPPVSVRLAPAAATLAPGEPADFRADITGSGNTAVTWSVDGTGGGTVDANGHYVAPTTPGDYTVRATSAADGSASGTAVVHVTSTITVAIHPALATVPLGDTQAFTTLVTGSTDKTVTFTVTEGAAGGTVSAAGVYTAPASGTGSYHVVATHAGGAATATVTVVGTVRSVSGTVNYTRGASGRIYVGLTWGAAGDGLMATTSLAEPGPYHLRGRWGPGNYTVVAWVDTLGSQFPVSSSPTGTAQVNLSSSVTGADVTITDPGPVAFPPPRWVWANSAPGVAMVRFESPLDSMQREMADAFRLYVGRDTPAGPGESIWVRTVPAGRAHAAMVAPLADGEYWVTAAPLVQGREGPTGQPQRFRVGPAPVGNTVQGTVTLPGGAGGTLYVLLQGGPNGDYFTRVPGASGTVPFSVPGVQPGRYSVVALLDTNHDGVLDRGDLVGATGLQGRTVAINGDATLPALTMPGPDTRAAVMTRHNAEYTGTAFINEGFGLQLEVAGQARQPVAVSQQAGGLGGLPVDLSLARGPQDWAPPTWMASSWDGSQTASGATLEFNVLYDDGTVERVTGTVGETLVLPRPVSPLGNAAGTLVPTFTWLAPNPVPTVHTYYVHLSPDAGYPRFWDAWDLAAGTLSVTYNYDGRASPPALTSGTGYQWQVEIMDDVGNSATAGARFVAMP